MASKITYQMQVGPITYHVNWNRSGAPSGKKILEKYTQEGKSFFDIAIQIGPCVEALSVAPEKSEVLEENWRVWKDNNYYILQIWDGILNEFSIEAKIALDFKTASIYSLLAHPNNSHLGLLLTTALRWITSNLLIQNNGIMIHGAAIQNKNGDVFIGTGPSGAGKTTLSSFFHSNYRFRVLSDETTLLIKLNDQYFAYGSPWHGMLEATSSCGGPLKKIFFLEKTLNHEINAISLQESIQRLLKEVFLPPWSEELTTRAINTSIHLLSKNTGNKLGFAKHPSIVDYIDGINL